MITRTFVLGSSIFAFVFLGYFPVSRAGSFLDSVVVIQKLNPDNGSFSIAGAGFVVTSEGHILTARHVLEAGPAVAPYIRLSVKFKNGDQFDADLVRADSALDLALLKINLHGTERNIPPPLSFGNSEDLVGSKPKLRVVGHPTRNGEPNLFEIDNMDVKAEHYGYIMLNNDLYPGDSGGPVIDQDDHVVGVVVARNSQYNEAYVMPCYYAQDLLLAVGINPMAGHSAPDYRGQVEGLQRGIDALTGELKVYKSAMKFLSEDLDWDVSLNAVEESDPVTRVSSRRHVLHVIYRKRYKEQLSPGSKVFLQVLLIMRPGATGRQNTNLNLEVLHATLQVPLKVDLSSLSAESGEGSTEIDQKLSEAISNCNHTNQTDFKENQIRSLSVRIWPEFREQPVPDEQQVTKSVDYN
jgi:hypothetical protein